MTLVQTKGIQSTIFLSFIHTKYNGTIPAWTLLGTDRISIFKMKFFYKRCVDNIYVNVLLLCYVLYMNDVFQIKSPKTVNLCKLEINSKACRYYK